MFSRFIHVWACIRISFLLSWKKDFKTNTEGHLWCPDKHAWPGGRVCGCPSTFSLPRNKPSPDSRKCPLKASHWWEGPRAPLIGSTKNLERVDPAMCRLTSHYVYHFNKSTSVFQPKRSSHNSMVVKVVLWPTASPPTGNLLKAQILQPNPRPTESKTLGVGPSNLVKKPSRWFWHILKLENHCSGVMILDSNYWCLKRFPNHPMGIS